jgi:peptidyl-prolyl cis-trans isomerase D
MATLEKIRSRAGVLIAVIIGLALLAFILGDLFDSGRSIFNRSQQEIAEIGDKTVQIQEFEAQVNNIEEIYKMESGQSNLDEQTISNIRDQVWQQLVLEGVFHPEFQKLGVAVGATELFDLVQGSNPHPVILQVFANPKTKEFNREILMNFLKSMDQDETGKQKAFWLYLENQITNDRLVNKYNTLVRQGLYVTSLQIKNDIKDNGRMVDMSYVSMPLSSIPDSTIKVSSSDLKDYYKKHKKEFKQNASRDIEYISFDIAASPEDLAKAKGEMDAMAPEFVAAADPIQYVNNKSDEPFVDHFFRSKELSDTLRNSIFNASVGTVVGPISDPNGILMAKLVEVKMIPDSIKASFILIRPDEQTKESAEKAKVLADSVKTVIEKGGNFAELAKKYSKDGSAEKGGDLGWIADGSLPKPMSDFYFTGSKGQLKVVETQYGYAILRIEDRGAEARRVKLAMLIRNIAPSSNTYQAIYQKASSFAGVNNTAAKFDAASKSENLTVRPANYLNENDKTLPGLANTREIIRWAYKAKKGDVSTVFEIDNHFIVAKVSEVREKGFAPLAQVKPQIETMVRRDKKAEQLAAKMKEQMAGVPDVASLAAKTGLSLMDATGVNFAAYTVPGTGFEPQLIATATCTPVGKMSEPIKGMNGVFVLQVKNITEADPNNAQMSQIRLNSMNMQRVNYGLFESMQEIVGVTDNRGRFY